MEKLKKLVQGYFLLFNDVWTFWGVMHGLALVVVILMLAARYEYTLPWPSWINLVAIIVIAISFAAAYGFVVFRNVVNLEDTTGYGKKYGILLAVNGNEVKGVRSPYWKPPGVEVFPIQLPTSWEGNDSFFVVAKRTFKVGAIQVVARVKASFTIKQPNDKLRGFSPWELHHHIALSGDKRMDDFFRRTVEVALIAAFPKQKYHTLETLAKDLESRLVEIDCQVPLANTTFRQCILLSLVFD